MIVHMFVFTRKYSIQKEHLATGMTGIFNDNLQIRAVTIIKAIDPFPKIEGSFPPIPAYHPEDLPHL